MCVLCEKYGNDQGDKWYLNPKRYGYNYGDDVSTESTMLYWLGNWQRIQDVRENVMTAKNIKYHQIVPIEDALKIADLNVEHSDEPLFDIFPCICATVHAGANLHHCMDFGFTSKTMERWVKMTGMPYPPPEQEDITRVNVEKWKETLIETDKNGYVHHVMLWGVATDNAYIAHICNCKLPYCSPLRGRDSFGQTDTYLKSHYIADLNALECNGCGRCAAYCQFGAIRVDHNLKTAYIDPRLCSGCGVCRVRCKPDAITLVDRGRVPIARHLW